MDVDQMKAELKAKSDADPLGFRKAAAWDAIFAADDLAALRKRLSADDIHRLVGVIVPASTGAHDWFTPHFIKYECCRLCGIVRRHDGGNKPCRGLVGVGPRDGLNPRTVSWNLCEALRASEGSSVTLVCDNPDFNGQPNNAVDCNGDWTGWNDQRFTGDTILDALVAAHDAMTAFEVSRLVADT